MNLSLILDILTIVKTKDVLLDVILTFSKKYINKAHYPNILIVLCMLYIYFTK